MKKPIIGISGSIFEEPSGMFPGYKKAYVNHDYVSSVIKNGGVPILIPLTDDENLIESQINLIDGLILSGGHDVSPKFYNEEPLQKLGEIMPERDTFDFNLIKFAKAKNIPILGICRGYQILNVYHGGSLHQDLSYDKNCYVKHWQAHSPKLVTHTVNTVSGTKLSKLFDKEEFQVNSFHHQIIKDVAPSLIVSAISKDGVVEALESEDYPFLLGVQWHPEMLHESVEEMNVLFSSLIKEAKKGI